VTVRDLTAFPLVGPGMDSEAADLLVGLVSSPTAPVAAPLSNTPTTGVFGIECDSSDVLKRLLVETDALTLMPRFLVDDDLRDGRLAIVAGVDLGLRVRFGAAWVKGRTLGGAGAAFVDLFRTHNRAASSGPA